MERALQSELDASWGAGAVEVSSAGTGALAGHGMDEHARGRLEQNGYTASGFLARDLTARIVSEADLVLTATRSHRAAVARLHPRALRYVFSFREFAALVGDVPDDKLRAPADSARGHILRAVGLAAAQRGFRPPLSDPEADIVDPYRRPDEVFTTMTGQIMTSLPVIAQALGRPC